MMPFYHILLVEVVTKFQVSRRGGHRLYFLMGKSQVVRRTGCDERHHYNHIWKIQICNCLAFKLQFLSLSLPRQQNSKESEKISRPSRQPIAALRDVLGGKWKWKKSSLAQSQNHRGQWITVPPKELEVWVATQWLMGISHSPHFWMGYFIEISLVLLHYWMLDVLWKTTCFEFWCHQNQGVIPRPDG